MSESSMDTSVATSRGEQQSRALLEGLVGMWARDASLLGAQAEAGVVLEHAAEALEFGLRDTGRAHAVHVLASRHVDGDPRAYAGLRRAARRDDLPQVTDLYERELRSPHLSARVFATLGLCLCLLRQGGSLSRVAQMLRDIESDADAVGPECAALRRSLIEDVLVIDGRPSDALVVRAARVDQLAQLGDDVREVSGAGLLAQTAILAGHAGTGEELPWYRRLQATAPDDDSTRILCRDAWRRGDAPAADQVLELLVQSDAPWETRARARFTQAMIARGSGDHARAVELLAPVVRHPGTPPIIARVAVDVIASSGSAADAELLVDALGAAVDAASGQMERAWMHAEMSRLFEASLQLPEAAIEFGQEACGAMPTFTPATELLEQVMTRHGHWTQLAALIETRLSDEAGTEGIQDHDHLAEIYLQELQDPANAERHLRAALATTPHLPSIRRLSRLLGEQHRWDELYEHLMSSVARLTSVREKMYLLELAGDVAQARLRSPERAIRAYRMMLTFTPAHSSAVASLGRLLSTTERWEELLELNERELSMPETDAGSRTLILCRSAEIMIRHVGDLSGAEKCFRRALEDDAAHDEALRGYLQLMQSQSRFDEVVAALRRAIGATVRTETRARLLIQLALVSMRDRGSAEAIDAWSSYAAIGPRHRAIALHYLEALHGERRDYRSQLAIMEARDQLLEDGGASSRLAFRAGAVREWSMRDVRGAFDSYMQALDCPQTVILALEALDRLWDHTDVQPTQRLQARVAITSRLEEWNGGLARQARVLLWERSDDASHASELLLELRLAWPDDLLIAERAALAALGAGQFDLAEEIREGAVLGPVDAIRVAWSSLDRGEDFVRPALTVDTWMPQSAAFLKREAGLVGGRYAGAYERELFVRIAAGAVPLTRLLEPTDSETSMRLAILAGRAAGRTDVVLGSWQAMAESLPHPWRAMRAWLDLAREEGVLDADRKRWLRRCAELKQFDCPLRSELYDAMQECGDIQGMVDAIAQHLDEALPEPEQAANLSARRARGLESMGQRLSALEAFRTAVIFNPDEPVYALEKSRLEVLSDLHDDARETLEDSLRGGCSGSRRLEMLGRLADLHLMDGGKPERAIELLEEAFSSKGSQDWGVRLSAAHQTHGDPARAAAVLKQVLVAPPREEDIRHWQQLARIQADHAGEVDAAEEVLWSVFEAFPQRANALSGLEEFYRRHMGAARLASRLGEWLSRRGDRLEGARLGQLWTYVGDLNLSVLKAWKDAEAAYRHAEKTASATALLSARLGRALVRQERGDRSAVPALLRALGTPGLDEMILREVLSDLDITYAGVRDSARLAVVRQVRRSLGETVELVESGIRRDPTRTVDPATLWELLGNQLGDPASREVGVAMAPLAERVLGRLAGIRRQLRGRKIRLDDPGTFENALGLVGNTLGVTPSRVLVGDGADRALAIDLRTNWLPDVWLLDDSSLNGRFWAGWCGGMQFAQGAPWTWADPQVADQVLRAVAARGLGRTDVDAGPFADDVAGIMLLPQRRAASLVLADNLEVLDGRPFAPGEWAEAMALRSGLLMAGDAGLALSCACAQAGAGRAGSTPEGLAAAVCARPIVLGLLQFALSDAYQLLRYETGLGARPAL